jgi:hypothetical protein
VRIVLQGEKAWLVVDPDNIPLELVKTQAAATTDSGDNSNTISAAPISIAATAANPATPSDTLDYAALRYRAIRIIIPTLKDSIMPHIMNLTDPREMWIKLHTLY